MSDEPPFQTDQRTLSAYIFGVICPEKGKGAGLIMPWCNTEAMNKHLQEISRMVDPGAHAVLMLDGAGWHTAGDLVVPDNITLLPLPPRARAEPSRECLAVPPPELARQPGLCLLRRHRRPVLSRLEQPDRAALENHVHRPARLGLSVMINARWYYSQRTFAIPPRAALRPSHLV
jgi:hypothetical protein